MKLPELFTKGRPLGERGIAHFFVPLVVIVLVGLVGTYMLVSSNANQGDPAAKNKNAYMVLFSQNGAYDTAAINVEGGAPAGYSCGTQFSKSDPVNQIVKKIKQPTAKKAGYTTIKCSATGNNAYYKVTFGETIGYSPSYVKYSTSSTVVDLDAGFCTFVHADGSTRKVENGPNGCNGSYNSEDPPKAQDVSLRSLPEISKDGTKVGGYADVRLAGKNLAKVKCSGSVHVVTTSSNPKTKFAAYDVPLKYTKNKDFNEGNSFCTVKLKNLVVKNRGADQDVTVTVNLPKTSYFNAAGPVAATVKFPKVDNGTGGTQAP